MDNTHTKFNWRIIAIGSVLVIFVLIVVIVLSLSLSTNQSNQKDWQTTKNQDYSISYPKEVTASPSSAGGTPTLNFQLPEGAKYDMHLQTFPSNVTSIIQYTSAFQRLNYQQSLVNIKAGEQAQLFKGVFTLGTSNFQDNIALIEKNGQIYKLQLTYDSLQRDPVADERFLEILRNLQLN